MLRLFVRQWLLFLLTDLTDRAVGIQAEEKDQLCEAVGRLGTTDWPGVSTVMGDRFTPESCRSAWRAMLREARIARGDVMSPCTKVCKLDKESSTYCYVRTSITIAGTPTQSSVLEL